MARVYVYVQNVYKQFRNVTTITETLDYTFPVAVVKETGKPDSFTGKFETLGSNFSQETARATGVRATFEKFSLGFLYTQKAWNDSSMLSLFFRLSFH